MPAFLNQIGPFQEDLCVFSTCFGSLNWIETAVKGYKTTTKKESRKPERNEDRKVETREGNVWRFRGESLHMQEHE